jgi:hypothetical protein
VAADASKHSHVLRDHCRNKQERKTGSYPIEPFTSG